MNLYEIPVIYPPTPHPFPQPSINTYFGVRATKIGDT